jgi:hypothetical protein
MPLLDHFHPPLSISRAWSSFHARWAIAIADGLNATLPSPRYLAETEVSIGREFKMDVVEFDQPPDLWPVPLDVGQPLPVLPLALRGSVTVPIDLEATYTEARRHCHL